MDEEILQSLKDGRPDAMLLLYQNLEPRLCKFVFGIVKNHQDAEDIVSETMIEFINKRKYLDINENLTGYMAIACKNRSLNFLRHTKRRVYLDASYHKNLYAQAQLYMNRYNESEEDKRKEQLELIYKAIEKLPKKRRQVMKMRYLQEKETKAIALETNQNPETVKRYLSLGVSNVKNMMGIRKAK